MDILKYASAKANTGLATCLSSTTACNTTQFQNAYCTAYTATYQPVYDCAYSTCYTSAYNSAYNSAVDSVVQAYSGYEKTGKGLIDLTPWDPSNWSYIPRLPGSASTSDPGTDPATGTAYSGFKVCATYLCTGYCCSWTVPAGASIARFQMWGAGGGSGSGCCCGGSPGGSTGAYASIIVPVTPGDTYTLCAGCANMCWGPWYQCTQNMAGSASYVTGPNLCNVCASGACGNLWCRLAYDMGATYWLNGCCKWTSPDCFAGGACICNGSSDFCFYGSCATCGYINFSASKVSTYYGCYNGSFPNTDITKNFGTIVAGIPSLNGFMCFDTNMYGVHCHPAIYGFESTSACCECFTSSCGGPSLYWCGMTNCRMFPGAGGNLNTLYGGCTARCDTWYGSGYCGGDRGRSGMVCVTYG